MGIRFDKIIVHMKFYWLSSAQSLLTRTINFWLPFLQCFAGSASEPIPHTKYLTFSFMPTWIFWGPSSGLVLATCYYIYHYIHVIILIILIVIIIFNWSPRICDTPPPSPPQHCENFVLSSCIEIWCIHLRGESLIISYLYGIGHIYQEPRTHNFLPVSCQISNPHSLNISKYHMMFDIKNLKDE